MERDACFFCVRMEPQKLAATFTPVQDTEKQVCHYLLPFSAE